MPVNKIIFAGETLIDLTADTVTPDTLLKGATAHSSNGEIITGTFEGGSATEEIDRILAHGLTDGFKYINDDGTIVSTSDIRGLKLVKTFSNDFDTCTTVLYDNKGLELGRITKNLSNEYTIITSVNSSGMKVVKRFDLQLNTCETTITHTDNTVIAKQKKIFKNDGTVVETNVDYF